MKAWTVILAIIGILSVYSEATARTYTTNFPINENPISESGSWVGGQTAGNNLWGNVQTNGTMAFGVTEPTQYGDPTAILTGTWGNQQTAKATIKVNTTPTGTCCHEAEVRLRMTINSSAHTITGYEVYCSVMPSPNNYCHIASWGGPNGSWVNMVDYAGSLSTLVNGDILEGNVSGTNPATITAYVTHNNVRTQIMSVQDSGNFTFSDGHKYGPWTTGNPGIGFYNNQDSNWSYFGFSSFTATDGLLDVDFDGDRKTDVAVYHSASGLWFIKPSSCAAGYSVGYGGPGYAPVPGDYDRDRKTDVAVYHSASGLWFIKPSSSGADYSVGYGGPGYVPVPGDFDGDAKTDIAVYHSTSGLWFVKPSSGVADYSVGYGGTGYTPVPGDYDGDGKTDIAVYHSASGLWFIKKSSDGSSSYVAYGGTGYVPVPGDYDGDGKTDIAVYHQASGLWFIKPSSSGADYSVGYGGPGYVPVPGNYDGDGKTDIAVYHSASGLWFIKPSSGSADYYVGYGGTDYTPLNLDYLHGYVY
jgi:hypothetical protein